MRTLARAETPKPTARAGSHWSLRWRWNLSWNWAEANDKDLKAAARAFQDDHLVPALQEVREVGGTVAIGSMRKR